MKNNIYCIYDSLSNRYGEIFAMATDGLALRNLREMYQAQCTDSQSRVFNKSRFDVVLQQFQICRVGSVDLENGVVTPEKAPVRLSWSDTPFIEQESHPVETTLPDPAVVLAKK